MDKIEQLSSRASVSQVTDLSKNVTDEIETAAIDDSVLNNDTAQLKANSLKMNEGLGNGRGKELTDELVNADLKRDLLLSALIQFLKAFETWDSPNYNAAAQKLMRIVKARGKGIAQMSYENESAAIDSILAEFEKPEVIEALTTLNLTLLAGELKTAQTNFSTISKKSVEIESAKTDNISPSSLRRETIDIINRIADHLTVMYRINVNIYGVLSAKVNELISGLNTKIRMHNSGSKTETPKTVE